MMTKQTFLKTALVCFAAVQMNFSQAQVQLPAPSPKATVMQQVGLTDITIDYSSPAVKGRAIWGDLVAYDKVWRAGANSASKITFSQDVTIGGTKVAKGTYSVLAIPGKAEWTMIINKDANASEQTYKQSDDVVRVKAVPTAIPSRERLQYSIVDATNEGATVVLEWEKVRVAIPVKVDTEKHAEENIAKGLGGVWGQYNNTARYYLDNKNYDKALEHANTASSLDNTQWFPQWVRAQALAGKGDMKGAYEAAAKAQELGNKTPERFWYKSQVDAAVESWKPVTTSKKKK
jgi:hypothetical protein